MKYAGLYDRGGLDVPSWYVTFDSNESPDEQDLFACLEEQGGKDVPCIGELQLVEIEILHDNFRRAIFQRF